MGVHSIVLYTVYTDGLLVVYRIDRWRAIKWPIIAFFFLFTFFFFDINNKMKIISRACSTSTTNSSTICTTPLSDTWSTVRQWRRHFHEDKN